MKRHIIIHTILATLLLISCGEDTAEPGDTSASDTATTTDTSDASDTGGCTDDDQCPRGQVCNGACEVLTCVDRADCGSNRVCLDDGTCSATECFTADDCDAGQSCIQQICVGASGGCSGPEDCAATNQVCNPISQQCEAPNASGTCAQDWQCVFPQTCDNTTGMCTSAPTTCAADSECSADQYCDTASGDCATGCRADTCSNGEACNLTTRECGPASMCTPSDCAANGNQACDLSTGQCVDRAGTGLCGECTTGSTTECGAPGVDRCVPLGGTGRCVFSCSETADCPSGFSCDAGFCTPRGGACTGCLITGCPSAQACNGDSGICEPRKDVCETCVEGQCVLGSECSSFGGGSVCLAACGAGGACATGFTCNTSANRCEPMSGTCP